MRAPLANQIRFLLRFFAQVLLFSPPLPSFFATSLLENNSDKISDFDLIFTKIRVIAFPLLKRLEARIVPYYWV